MATPNLSLTLPTVGASTNTWGTELNTALTAIDTWAATLVLKNGTTAFSAAQGFFDGTVSLPGMTFSGDTNSGFYRIGADNIGVTLGGVKKLDLAATAITVGATTKFVTAASTTTRAGLSVPTGTAPTSKADGDVYNDGTNLYVYIGSTLHQLTNPTSGGVTSFNSRTGAVSLTSSDVTTALGFTPVTNARTVSGTGMLSGGGALSSNQTINLASQSAATIIGRASGAGTGVPTALSAAQVAAIVESLLDLSDMSIGTGAPASFYVKIGSLYIQWGSVSVTPAQSGTGGQGTASFAVEFPTACSICVPFLYLNGGGLGSGINVTPYIEASSPPTTTNATIGLDQDGAGSPGAMTVGYLALGY